MVENQCGSSDMIQSMKAKVVTNTNTTRPGALTRAHFCRSAAHHRCILLGRPFAEPLGVKCPDKANKIPPGR